MRITVLSAAIFAGAVAWPSITYSQKWVAQGVPWNYWISVASSADGTKLFAAATNGPVYASTNSGDSWALTTLPSNPWTVIVETGDGNNVAAGAQNGSIYVSTNGGAQWRNSSFSTNSCRALACTPDGSKLLAGIKTSLYLSTNWGLSWSTLAFTNAPFGVYSNAPFGASSEWRRFGFSLDGTKMVAIMATAQYYPSVSGGYCWASTNSGSTWQLAQGGQVCGWSRPLAISPDGKNMLSFFTLDRLNTSTNYGMSWTLISTPRIGGQYGLPNLASSSGLKTLVAAKAGTPISISTNSAVTWTAMDVFPLQWSAIAGSADASKLVAVSLDGGVFRYQSVPSLNIGIVSEAAVLTWSASGADFQLQRTVDLINPNWVAVTNAPAVVNGQSQVTLPVSGQSFFRLKSR